MWTCGADIWRWRCHLTMTTSNMGLYRKVKVANCVCLFACTKKNATPALDGSLYTRYVSLFSQNMIQDLFSLYWNTICKSI